MKYPLSHLGAGLERDLRGKDFIVFDGVCVLCHGFFRFMLRHDRQERFSYAMAQSPVGQACYGAMGLPLDDFDTNLVVIDGVIHTDLDAFAAAMGALPWPWKALRAAGWLPAPIKRPLYRSVAKNRYRLFGQYDTCMVPDESLRARFLADGMA